MTHETLTLSQTKQLIKALASRESMLLLSAPGVGKSDIVRQAATEAGLEVRSLLGTQIAPEDVSGVPRIVGERSVFCPPRVLLPEDGKAFCLFLDEFPAASPDVQKALYALLLERRLGEYPLPEGTWVVAAGNRQEDRALVRQMSSALVNRTFLIHIRTDNREWLEWAGANNIRPEIRSFILFQPESLMRPVPDSPTPFSTPRAWASLSEALDLAEKGGILSRGIRRALAFGRVSPEDAAVFCAMEEGEITDILPLHHYLHDPTLLPKDNTAMWFVLSRLRREIEKDPDGFLTSILEAPFKNIPFLSDPTDSGKVGRHEKRIFNDFLRVLPLEHCFALLVGNIQRISHLDIDDTLLDLLREATGMPK